VSRRAPIAAVVQFDLLDWTVGERLDVPCLVVHSEGDHEVPAAMSHRFVAARPHWAAS
jgi:hypothetical protein